MPQNNPRGREPRVIRVTRTSAARSAAAMLWPGTNGISAPSKVNDSVLGRARVSVSAVRLRRRMGHLRCEEACRIERGKTDARLIARKPLSDDMAGGWRKSDTSALVTVRVEESRHGRIRADEGKVIGRERPEPVICTDHPHVAEDREQPD